MKPDDGVKAAQTVYDFIAVFIMNHLFLRYLEGLADIGNRDGKIESPTVIFMPSTIASVRGIFMLIVVPKPASLEMEIVPPTDSTFFLTTSIPTPRPEYSVTAWLVENPGSIISPRASFDCTRSRVL